MNTTCTLCGREGHTPSKCPWRGDITRAKTDPLGLRYLQLLGMNRDRAMAALGLTTYVETGVSSGAW